MVHYHTGHFLKNVSAEFWNYVDKRQIYIEFCGVQVKFFEFCDGHIRDRADINYRNLRQNFEIVDVPQLHRKVQNCLTVPELNFRNLDYCTNTAILRFDPLVFIHNLLVTHELVPSTWNRFLSCN